jgi:catechol 2,3-dioxygenase-like lactoylglutathione lyase family enzyme
MTSIIDHISLGVRDYDTAKRFYDQTPQPFDARGRLTLTATISLCGTAPSRASRIGLHR